MSYLLMTKNQMLCPTAPTARPRQPPWGKRAAGDRLTSGNVGPPSADPGAILILLVARFLTLIAARQACALFRGRDTDRGCNTCNSNPTAGCGRMHALARLD